MFNGLQKLKKDQEMLNIYVVYGDDRYLENFDYRLVSYIRTKQQQQ